MKSNFFIYIIDTCLGRRLAYNSSLDDSNIVTTLDFANTEQEAKKKIKQLSGILAIPLFSYEELV